MIGSRPVTTACPLCGKANRKLRFILERTAALVAYDKTLRKLEHCVPERFASGMQAVASYARAKRLNLMRVQLSHSIADIHTDAPRPRSRTLPMAERPPLAAAQSAARCNWG